MTKQELAAACKRITKDLPRVMGEEEAAGRLHHEPDPDPTPTPRRKRPKLLDFTDGSPASELPPVEDDASQHGNSGEPPPQPNPANPTNSTASPTRAQFPEDSIIGDFMKVGRRVAEAPDSIILAPFLTLLGYLLVPCVYWEFGAKKYTNLFYYVIAPPGVRKTTAFGPTEAIAKALLSPEAFHQGNASDSALFDKFDENPHRVQFEDDANIVVAHWEGIGKELPTRYLSLYDGRPWAQCYQKNRSENSGPDRYIDEATMSFCMGGTFNVSTFGKIPIASGLRRRFLYAVESGLAREIEWPEPLGSVESICDQLRPLMDLEGVAEFTPDARERWGKFQAEVRQQQAEIADQVTASAEAKGASLNELPSQVLKLSLIFNAAVWAKVQKGKPLIVTEDSLKCAIDHANTALEAEGRLEIIGRRAAIREKAEQIHAKIMSGIEKEQTSQILSKSQLTTMFVPHAGRGGMTTSKLYDEIIPDLIQRGLAKLHSKIGKQIKYEFFSA